MDVLSDELGVASEATDGSEDDSEDAFADTESVAPASTASVGFSFIIRALAHTRLCRLRLILI